MQGFERADRQLLDAAALAGHLVPAGSMFAFLAAHRAEVFPDADYADLFAPPGLGRPSVPATQMAAVLTLQALHDYSDRETAEAVRFDVRWKVAIGAALDDPGFDPSTLVYWRQADGEVGAAAPGQRRGQQGDRADRGAARAGGAGRWTRRSWLMRWPPRTRSPSWSRRSAGWPGRCPARRSRSRRCAPGTTTPGRASRRSTGTTRPRRTRWSRRWSTTRTRWWPRSQGADLDEPAASALALLALVAGQDVEPAEGSDGPRRAVADRPQGRRRPGDLHRGPRGPAHPQVPRGPPGRVPRARGRRPGDRDHHR